MKAGVLYGPHDIRVEEVPDPIIEIPTDAIVTITNTCICGSDLWYYRGLSPMETKSRIGHEFMGEVTAVGDNVKTVHVGDLVVGPFWWCDGTCPFCKVGMSITCPNGAVWGGKGTYGCQAEKLRVPFADANVFAVPKDQQKEELMPSLLALSDVMGTGHHAAVMADVSEGKTVAVVGDGTVGLCAVLASKRLGAKQIFLLSHHDERSLLGIQFGATDIVKETGDEAVTTVKELTNTLGVDCALECVGTAQSWGEALGMVRPGGSIGYVGVPHDVPDFNVMDLFSRDISIGGGPAPTRTYIPHLMQDVLSGKLDSAPVFDLTLPLTELAKGYDAMDKREAIKVLIKP